MAKASPFVFQRSNTEGTGPLELVAAAGFQTFALAFPDNDGATPFFYCIRDKTTGEYENGNGYLNVDGDLVRSPLESSNAGSLVDFGDGLKDVTCDVPAIYQENIPNVQEPFTSAEKTKLSGIAPGATANQSNSYLLDRANHTGTQPPSTISNFDDAARTAAGELIGDPNGFAGLDGAAKLPAVNLPTIALTSNVTGITGAVAIANIVEISQANYDALSAPVKAANTFIIPE